MIKPIYPVHGSSNGLKYQFVSIGNKGRIQKEVIFKATSVEGIFNLGFGDVDPKTGLISDAARSNNGDRTKVLATVGYIVWHFLNRFPKCSVIATGSTDSRTRLYQMAISRYIYGKQDGLQILGFTEEGNWETFVPEQHYIAFLASKKS